MVENGLKPIRTFAQELRAEGYAVDRDVISKVIKPLRIKPKRMTNGKALGLDEKDQEKLRKFFAPSKEQAALAS